MEEKEEQEKEKAVFLGFTGYNMLQCGFEFAAVLPKRLPEEEEKKLELTYVGEVNGAHVYRGHSDEAEKYIRTYFNVKYG